MIGPGAPPPAWPCADKDGTPWRSAAEAVVAQSFLEIAKNDAPTTI